MLKFIATYILTLLTLFFKSQTLDTFKISGVVVSAFNKKSIPHGTIMFTRTNGYQCDSLGKFTIYGLAKGQHKLTFSTFGYPSTDTILTIDNDNILNFTWTINTTCNGNYNTQSALDDIKQGKVNLLIFGGIAPVIYATDKDFKEKYKIGYDVFGCVAPDMDECLMLYNQTIFEYLDKTYGKKWCKEARKDVIGLKRR
jgi:CarboxypepD_reg-like domain